MTVYEALKSSGINRLDAEVIMSHLLGKPREWIIAHNNSLLPASVVSAWRQLILRRKNREPVAYITGKKEFYGRTFRVTPDVLIPRPATEGLIEFAMDFLATGNEMAKYVDKQIVAAGKRFGDLQNVSAVADIGTGSGCIAITLKFLIPEMKIYATDISDGALNIAKKNAALLNTGEIIFRKGSFLEPVSDICEPFIVVSNPPYIPETENLPEDISAFEPASALYGGQDGTAVLLKMLAAAARNKFCMGICFECREQQWKKIIDSRKLNMNAGAKTHIIEL